MADSAETAEDMPSAVPASPFTPRAAAGEEQNQETGALSTATTVAQSRLATQILPFEEFLRHHFDGSHKVDVAQLIESSTNVGQGRIAVLTYCDRYFKGLDWSEYTLQPSEEELVLKLYEKWANECVARIPDELMLKQAQQLMELQQQLLTAQAVAARTSGVSSSSATSVEHHSLNQDEQSDMGGSTGHVPRPTHTTMVRVPRQMTALGTSSVNDLQADMRSAQSTGNKLDLTTVISLAIQNHLKYQLKDDLVCGHWTKWPESVLIPALRGLVDGQQDQDATGVESAERKILADWQKGLHAWQWTSCTNWLIGVGQIVQETVTDTVLASSVSSDMKLLRDTIIKILKTTTFGFRVAVHVQTKCGDKIAWEDWWQLVNTCYGDGRHILDAYLTYMPKEKTVMPLDGKTIRGGKRNREQLTSTASNSTGNPSSAQTTGTRDCWRCGRTNHYANACKIRGHPDTNTDNKVKWADSAKGKAWAAKGKDACPMTQCLDGSTYTIPCKFKYIPDVYKCSTCSNLCHDIPIKPESNKTYTVGSIHKCKLINPTNNTECIELEVLLDTGCYSQEGRNFISREVAGKLKAVGYHSVVEPNHRLVCSCFSQVCKPVEETFKLKISFYDPGVRHNRTLELTCDVIDTPHDIIVGYETIKALDALRTTLIQQLSQVDEPTEIVDEPAGTSESVEETGVTSQSQPELDHLGTMLEAHRTLLHVSHVSRRKRARINSERTCAGRVRSKQKRKKFLLKSRKKVPPPRTEDNQTSASDMISSIVGDSLNLPTAIDGSTPKMIAQLRLLCEKFAVIFRTTLSPDCARVTPMDIEFKPDTMWETRASQQPARLQSRLKAEEIVRQVDSMLASGVIRVSTAKAHSQVMLTPKKDGAWRFCIDYRRLNVITSPTHWPLPRIKDMLYRLGDKRAKYYAVMDLTKGYYQAPLSEMAKMLTAFITPNGLYEWNRVAMGLTGAPSYFQKIMCTEVLNGLLYNICEIYLDDIIVFGRTEEEFLTNLEAVMKRLQQKNISLNPNKCKIGLTEVEYVGHTINHEGIKFSREKLQQVVNIARPTTAKGLKSFCGLANYFREHVRNHSTYAKPLNDMLIAYDPRKQLVWTEEATNAFNTLKTLVNECPQLFFIDDSSPVHLYTDASLTGIGAYLCQVREGKEVPIAFYSKSLRPEETKWGIPCLEAYAIWQAFHHFDYLLRDAHTHVHTDHKNLVYIRESGSDKIIRWKLDLQEYSSELDAIAGVDNPIADYMSRNDAAEEHDFIIETPKKAVNMLNTMWTETATRDNIQNMEIVNNNAILDYSTIHIPEDAYMHIKEVHNEAVGHHGVEQTLEKLAMKDIRWPHMREHVRKFCRECDNCQKASYLQYDIKAPRYTIGKYLPMERISVDLVGKLKKSKSGNQYVLMTTDMFTRFVTATPIADKSKTTIAKALLIHFGYFGVPYEITSDNGGEFVNGVVEELLELVDAKKTTTLAYSHQENSIVERVNQDIVKFIRHMIYGERALHATWEECLPFAVRIHNATPHVTTKYAPAELLFGESVMLDRQILLPKENWEETIDLGSWCKDRRTLQDKMIARAQQGQQKVQDRHLAKQPDTVTEFRSGEYVLLAYPETAMRTRRPSKLCMMHKGPYKVHSHINHEYTIENLVTHEREQRPIFMLRPYYYDATRTNPQDMALKDFRQEFYVEAIVAHNGSWKKLNQMTFTVKWFGHEQTDDDQKWSDLRLVDKMHDYLRVHNQEQLIPELDDTSEDDDSDTI